MRLAVRDLHFFVETEESPGFIALWVFDQVVPPHPDPLPYVFSVVAARATERGLQSVGVLISEAGLGILRARLCSAHVPAG